MTDPRPIRTVGDLVEHLQEFDQYMPVRTRQAQTSEAEFIVGVATGPDRPGTVSIVYMPLPRK